MITESGRVVAIESDCLWVETVRQSSCQSCSVQKGCGHGLLNSVGMGKLQHVRALLAGKQATDFVVGDNIEIAIPERLLVGGALLVYILPLLCLLFGALIASQSVGLGGWKQDAFVAAGAVVGFALGCAVVKWHAIRHRYNPDMQPIVVKRLAHTADSDNLAVSV